MHVEVGVPWGLNIGEAALILWGSSPWRMWGRRGDHHEEGPIVGLVLEELQRGIGLKGHSPKRTFY